MSFNSWKKIVGIRRFSSNMHRNVFFFFNLQGNCKISSVDASEALVSDSSFIVKYIRRSSKTIVHVRYSKGFRDKIARFFTAPLSRKTQRRLEHKDNQTSFINMTRKPQSHVNISNVSYIDQLQLHANGRKIVGQQLPTLLDVTCCVRLDTPVVVAWCRELLRKVWNRLKV